MKLDEIKDRYNQANREHRENGYRDEHYLTGGYKRLTRRPPPPKVDESAGCEFL